MNPNMISLPVLTTQHTDVLQWIADNAPTFEFAKSLQGYFTKNSGLTVGQVAAAKKLMVPKATPAAVDVGTLGVQQIQTAFDTAMEKGIKRPKLRLGAFTFKPAKATGKNPGAIYVTLSNNDAYLGKVCAAKFMPVTACTAEQQDAIMKACASPHEAAVAFGKKTGSCACCGRELTTKISIELGIGPICAKTYGWI